MFSFLIEILSIKISPVVVSYNLLIKVRIVDFPEPVFPKIANVFPFSTSKETFLSAFIFVSS